MVDPFEVRIRFSAQLERLGAGINASQKAAQYALRNKELGEDLHSCILEQLLKTNMNTRANIMYFIEHLLEMALKDHSNNYVGMMQRDIVKVVDAVCPEDGSGAANVKVVQKVLRNLRSKYILLEEVVVDLETKLKSRGITANDISVSSPIDGPDYDSQQQQQQQQLAGQNSKHHPSQPNGGNVSTTTDNTASTTTTAIGANPQQTKRQIEQRIEEDRERHKRMRENMWVVPSEIIDQAQKFFLETSDLGEDDRILGEEENLEFMDESRSARKLRSFEHEWEKMNDAQKARELQGWKIKPQRHVIDVVYEFTSRDSNNADKSSDLKRSRLPCRIPINSPHIVSALNEMTSPELPKNCQMLPPFKIIVDNCDKIRNYHAKLKQDVEFAQESINETEENGDFKKQAEIIKAREIEAHFHCLINLMEDAPSFFLSTIRPVAYTKFTGGTPVLSLPIYPLKFLPEAQYDEIKESLLNRGIKFRSLAEEAAHREYRGMTLDSEPEEIDGRVIVDFKQAPMFGPSYQADPNPRNRDGRHKTRIFGLRALTRTDDPEVEEIIGDRGDLDLTLYNDHLYDMEKTNRIFAKTPILTSKSQETSSEDLKEDDLRLLPGTIYAYILRSRQYCRCDVDLIQSIQLNRAAFDDLVLPFEHKQLI
ncbi:CTD kinase subunit gamma CTK3-domain-containing protein [Xylariaceae sp. FL0255]|nr:CTD kinase subunit gamma CTK3-domain-containing protein [Xylariaceae sp. FL0255]